MPRLPIHAALTAICLAWGLSFAAHAAVSDKAFVISNTGSGALAVSGVQVTDNTTDFSVIGNTCGTVPSGNNCTITVRFNPSAVGTRPAGNLRFSSNGTNGPNHVIPLSGTGASACAGGKVAYSYIANFQNITVPAGCTSAIVKVWGAGGASGSRGLGGGGGFAQRTVTGLTPGSGLVVQVGGGGPLAQGVSAFGGGGVAYSSYSENGAGAGGGGLTGVFRSPYSAANALVIAGGGGGGGSGVCVGAAGGGSSGASGAVAADGRGGTQSTGGPAGGGCFYGCPSQGGGLAGGWTESYESGGGGGGWFGGGGGGNQEGSGYGGCGGGGSGYAPGGTLTAGSGCNVANSGDPDYAASLGRGGCTPGVGGQNGRIVIQWQ